MFQCPACDFTSTYSKNNVKSHMVSLHGLAGDPISYMDKYAAQVDEFMKMCFPNGGYIIRAKYPILPIKQACKGLISAHRLWLSLGVFKLICVLHTVRATFHLEPAADFPVFSLFPCLFWFVWASLRQ
ncbi:unnamed protein product [Cylicostephanus goldi]|uniref:Uncharacterized protein n=1 Tax=Cylicostephanus goldi TaxID=71465 RepID=A0A3P6RUD0_CYLGO|nr:unnamed protein product [Cylicostephanus goldi]